VAQRVIHDDRYPEKSAKPLKSKERKKRRIHRQKSSFIVKTPLNRLISLKIQ
jgi:hypothetical protein